MPLTLRQRQINEAHGILSTAAETGIGYWCLLRSYRWSGGVVGNDPTKPFRVAPLAGWEQNDRNKNDPAFDGPPQFTVSAEGLVKAIRRLSRDETMPTHWRRDAAGFLVDPEGADFDSIEADVLFQYAALGSIVYG